VRLYHSVGGDVTLLSSADVTISGGGEILKGESDGTLQTLTYDGVQRIQQSNTAIISGVRAGIRGAANFADNSFRFDNWRASDVGAAPATGGTMCLEAATCYVPGKIAGEGKPIGIEAGREWKRGRCAVSTAR